MIVGIGNNYQVGKDTAAQALCRDLGYRRVAFADKLKDLAFDIDPLVTSQTMTVNVGAGRGRLRWLVQGVGWDDAKKMYPEVREFLQRLGSAGRKLFGQDFWIEQALAGAEPGERVVVSDVRYRNEAEAIKARGGIVIQIQRPGYHGDDHPSERDFDDWDGWDHVIVNDGSLKDLELKVVETVRAEIKREAEYSEAVDHELGYESTTEDGTD